MTHPLAQTPPELYRRPLPAQSATKLVPFDQVVTLKLAGERDNLVRAVTNISVEGQFVATAIGYSLLTETGPFGAVEPEVPDIQDEVFSPPVAKNPPQALLTLKPGKRSNIREGRLTIKGEPDSKVEYSWCFEADHYPPGKNEENIPVSGELKIDKPIFSGERKSVKGDIDIKDKNNNLDGTKVKFTIRTTEREYKTPRFDPHPPVISQSAFGIIGSPKSRINVKLTTQDISSDSFEIIKETDENGLLTVNLPKPLAPADQITVFENDTISARLKLPELKPARPDRASGQKLVKPDLIRKLPLGSIPSRYLSAGFRLRPIIMRSLGTGTPIPLSERWQPFEPCARTLSFLYTITDLGSGRELQSAPIHNLAGLGIADGDRPFRTFPKPIVFKPRSVIQFEVREISGGPGTLYFVLQGYKVLRTGNVRTEV